MQGVAHCLTPNGNAVHESMIGRCVARVLHERTPTLNRYLANLPHRKAFQKEPSLPCLLQTLANVWLALEGDLTVIPVLNKIDLPGWFCGGQSCQS